MANYEQDDSPKVRAARENGSLGGFKTAANHSQEWLDDRALKGGKALVERYSTDYYRWINAKRVNRRGWPLGKMRKSKEVVGRQLQQDAKTGELSGSVVLALEQMLYGTT